MLILEKRNVILRITRIFSSLCCFGFWLCSLGSSECSQIASWDGGPDSWHKYGWWDVGWSHCNEQILQLDFFGTWYCKGCDWITIKNVLLTCKLRSEDVDTVSFSNQFMCLGRCSCPPRGSDTVIGKAFGWNRSFDIFCLFSHKYIPFLFTG